MEHVRASGRKGAALLNRRVISLSLVVIGVVLLGYVAGQYWGMYRSQQNLEAEWQRQAATVSVPGKPPFRLTSCSRVWKFPGYRWMQSWWKAPRDANFLKVPAI